MITHNDYISGKATHREYYGEIARDVEASGELTLPSMTLGELKAHYSQGENLNTIALHRWDSLAQMQRDRIAPFLKERGDTASLGMLVCVLKEAARIRIGE